MIIIIVKIYSKKLSPKEVKPFWPLSYKNSEERRKIKVTYSATQCLPGTTLPSSVPQGSYHLLLYNLVKRRPEFWLENVYIFLSYLSHKSKKLCPHWENFSMKGPPLPIWSQKKIPERWEENTHGSLGSLMHPRILTFCTALKTATTTSPQLVFWDQLHYAGWRKLKNWRTVFILCFPKSLRNEILRMKEKDTWSFLVA